MRSFPSLKRQKNFTGLYYAATMDAHVGFESWLERDVAMTLDFDSRGVAFSSQPFWLWWPENGEQRQAGTPSADWLNAGKQVHSFLATSGPVMRASSGKVAAMMPRAARIPPAVMR